MLEDFLEFVAEFIVAGTIAWAIVELVLHERDE